LVLRPQPRSTLVPYTTLFRSEEAERCGMYYVNVRWLGGMLTNFETIKKRIARLKELEHWEETGEMERRPKKEVAGLRKEAEKLRSEEHTSELQSRENLVCRLL